MDALQSAARAYTKEKATRAAELREPLKRVRAVTVLHHAADLIRAHSSNEGVAAEVERIADRIAASLADNSG